MSKLELAVGRRSDLLSDLNREGAKRWLESVNRTITFYR